MVVTFYSFKGGVGRSLALANVAEVLADFGYRVIVCDWDLEAPGLERYFVPNNLDTGQYRQVMDGFLAWPGLVDLLVEYKATLAQPPGTPPSPETHAAIGDVWLRRPSTYAQGVGSRQGPGSIRLLTAGRRLGDARRAYGEAIRRFDWQQFYDDWAGDAYMDFFRKDLSGEAQKGMDGAADILLVDSRTGVTEQGGVCTHHLADMVLVLTAANDLNMEGARWMVQSLSDSELAKARGGRALAVLPIASRIEQTAQTRELVEFRHQFLADFGSSLSHFATDPSALAIATEVPYMPYYSYHERVVARESEAEREQNYYTKYQNIAKTIVDYGVKMKLLRERTAQGITARPAALSPGPSPAWDTGGFLANLGDALSRRDTAAIGPLLATLEREVHERPEPFPETDADRILTAIELARQFGMLRSVAEDLISAGLGHPRLRFQYARALVELGDRTLAQSMLQGLLGETAAVPAVNVEVRSLLGRISRDEYLSAPDRSSTRSIRNLERAINEYQALYLEDPKSRVWAGLNVVGLAQRALHERVTLSSAPEPTAMARELLAIMRERGGSQATPGPDDMGLAEIHVALGEIEHAASALLRFVQSDAADAFALGSARAALTGLWGLDERTLPGGLLLALVDAAMLNAGESRVSMVPEAWEAASHLAPTFAPLGRRRAGLALAPALVRLESSRGDSVGAGVLVRGDQLHPPLGPRPVLLTVSRVLSPDTNVSGALRPTVASVVRRFGGTETRHRVTQVLFTSSPDALDLTVADIEPVPDVPSTPSIGASKPGSVALLVTPESDSTFGLATAQLQPREAATLPYRCVIDAAAPGSPMFSETWALLGLHRSGNAQPETRWTEGRITTERVDGTPVLVLQDELRRHLGDKARDVSAADARRPARVLVSYAHQDEALREELGLHLKVLERVGLVAPINVASEPRGVSSGDDWHAANLVAMDSADIAVILVSADYIASEYIYSFELQYLLSRHAQALITLLPVLVRPVNVFDTPLAALQMLPRDGTPVTVWANRDAAWASVAEGIRAAVEQTAARRQP